MSTKINLKLMKKFLTFIFAVAFSATMFAQFNDMIFQRPMNTGVPVTMAKREPRTPRTPPTITINAGGNMSTYVCRQEI